MGTESDQDHIPADESSRTSIFDFTPEMSVGNEAIAADHLAFFQ